MGNTFQESAGPTGYWNQIWSHMSICIWLSLKHLFNVKICKKLSKTVKEPNEPNSGGTDSESLFSYPFCLISFYNSHASLNVSYEFAEEMILRWTYPLEQLKIAHKLSI